MIDKPICRGLLVCMRTTIGSEANDYSFRMQTTIHSHPKQLLVRVRTTITIACSLLVVKRAYPSYDVYRLICLRRMGTRAGELASRERKIGGIGG